MKTSILLVTVGLSTSLAWAAEPLIVGHPDAALDDGAHQVLGNLEAKATVSRCRAVKAVMPPLDTEEISIELFPGLEVTATKVGIGATGVASKTWCGQLANGEGSVCLVVNGERIAGKINSIHGNYAIYPLGGGNHSVLQYDLSKFPACDCEGEGFPAPDPGAIEAAQAAEDAANDPLADELDDDSPRVRVIVAYTASARSKTSSNLGMTMQELIDLAVLETNQGYANSNVVQRMELAYLYQTGYVDAGDLSIDVPRFRNTGDGFADEVHTHRNNYDADMCCLITNDTDAARCGRAYGFDYTSATGAFQATDYDCATGNYSFAHEFGHTQGCRHDTDTTGTPFSYARGFRQGTTTWRTIMAVTSGNSATRLNYWSNPGITSPVSPFVAMGNAGQDNSRALDVGDFTTLQHRVAPNTDTLVDVVGNDEIADKFSDIQLTVNSFTAQSGSRVTLRGGKVLLKPGFRANFGSETRVLDE